MDETPASVRYEENEDFQKDPVIEEAQNAPNLEPTLSKKLSKREIKEEAERLAAQKLEEAHKGSNTY